VAAGQHLGDEVDVELLEFVQNLEREMQGEGEVVCGVDDEDPLGSGGEALHVGHGADAEEQLADLVLSEASVLQRDADVAGALALPDDVAEPGGGVVEGADAQARVVGRGDEGVAGAEAGSKDAELRVALGLQPVDATADVDDGLAAGGGGAADVGADGVVGALQFGGAADVVIGLGEAESRDPEAV